jgi:hypothetical protein
MNNVEQFATDVINNFVRDITDHIFLYIQNDKGLMDKYMSLFNDNYLKDVNPIIGMKVKEILNLENNGESEQAKSCLIKTYTYHKVKS